VPGKLSDERRRVSFAEEIEIVDKLKAIADHEGKTLTDIYAEASRLFLEHKNRKHTNHQPTERKKKNLTTTNLT